MINIGNNLSSKFLSCIFTSKQDGFELENLLVCNTFDLAKTLKNVHLEMGSLESKFFFRDYS